MRRKTVKKKQKDEMEGDETKQPRENMDKIL